MPEISPESGKKCREYGKRLILVNVVANMGVNERVWRMCLYGLGVSLMWVTCTRTEWYITPSAQAFRMHTRRVLSICDVPVRWLARIDS